MDDTILPFFGLLMVYLFKKQIIIENLINLFFNIIYFYYHQFIWLCLNLKDDKRTDYPGKNSSKSPNRMGPKFDEPIGFVIGDEWKAGNLSYHLKSRPKWEGFLENNKLDAAKEYICIDDICIGTYK